jgi:hypothetical protein
MFATHSTVNLTKSSPEIVYLEINGPEDKDIQIPVKVTNLSSGAVRLEAQRPWSRLEVESLRDRESRLLLWGSGRHEPCILKGKAIRFQLANFSKDISTLEFELDRCDTQTAIRLNDAIDHVSIDRKMFWKHWDETQISSGTRFSRYKIYFLGVILACGGLACYQTEVESLKIVAGMLWGLSGLLGAGNAMWSLWQNRKIAPSVEKG